ncbi:hypothetical protein GOEFS_018_00360 [Gordonia effusa NBRC 100432]|uniref:DUF2339 domain-containing protein n=1 Tax=Gordonia effusa NBRC 100432 TaxID=1077974 RepID=H0QW02_9ACTN|nr:DUF2339 domain-containing protein [Gordonia effusa]GAB17003.1 hypothetical protein GOEFS_018_00360 [Gordonia effusa NBRC 100432]
MNAPDPAQLPPTLVTLARLTADCADLSRRASAISNDLAQVRRWLSEPSAAVGAPTVPAETPAPAQIPPGYAPAGNAQPVPGGPPYGVDPRGARQPFPPMYPTSPPNPLVAPYPSVAPYPKAPPSPARPPRRPTSQIIGRVLAAVGVGITLIGVVLLLVLAAQAGLLRPELRVAGGALLAVALLAAGLFVFRRPDGRVGGIALAATGIGAAYLDAMATSTIYHWLPSAAALIVAGLIAVAGLALSRWWDSEWIGVLVIVPLVFLGPVITRGFDFTLIAFMLVLSAAALWVPIGKDWIGYYAARTAASTVPLTVGCLAASGQLAGDDAALLIGCTVVNALLAVGSALIVLRPTTHRVVLVAISGTGAIPLAVAAAVVDPRICAAVIAAYAVILVALGAGGRRIAGVTVGVRIAWFSTAALAATIALPMTFDQTVVVPVLLAVALGLAAASTTTRAGIDAAFAAMMRIIATCLAVLGGMALLVLCPPWNLASAPNLTAGEGISGIVASLLAAGAVVALAASYQRADGRTIGDNDRVRWTIAGVIAVYEFTQVAVVTGVLIAGPDGGFLGGHMAATIGWIAVAAGILGYATRVRGVNRTLLVSAGLALTAGAVGKLFLFDLATLNGLFRVAAFIVVGLVLLALGAGYARLLDNKAATP